MADPVVQSLAAGRVKLLQSATMPEGDPKALTLAEVKKMLDISCRVSKETKLGPTGEDTVSEGALCDEFDPEVPTRAKYDNNQIVPFRYFRDGKPEPTSTTGGEIGDAAFQAVAEIGATVFYFKRHTSKKSNEPLATGDPYLLMEVLTGQVQESEYEGYMKNPCNVFPKRVWRGVIAGA